MQPGRDDADVQFFVDACAEYGVLLAGVLPQVMREVAAQRRFLGGVG